MIKKLDMGLPVQTDSEYIFMASQIVLGSAVSLNHKKELYFPDNYFYGFPHYCAEVVVYICSDRE